MKNNLGVFGVVLGVMALAVGGFALFKAPQVVQVPTPQYGALPVLSNPVVIGDGLQLYGKTIPMAASTSPCAFKTPPATTTIISLGAAGTALGGAEQLEWGVSNIQGATTTIIAHYESAPNTYFGFEASSSVNLQAITAYSGQGQIAPNSYISLKAGTSSQSTNIAGNCSILLRQNTTNPR